MARCPDVLYMSEYIQNILYFATVNQGKSLRSTTETHFFSIDNDLTYDNYYNDFGPLNLGCVYKYCKLLDDKLKIYLNKQCIVHYTSIEPRKKANAAFLLGCYGVLYLGFMPRDALKPLLMYGQTYRPFQDATQGDSRYTITILDCLNAIKKAKELGFFNFHDFNFEEYDRLDKIQGGDLNWIVPGKFIAFMGPVDYNVSLYHPPDMYITYFKENNVHVVIRLNKRMYDSSIFTNEGIYHYDLFFPDGSCPPRNILFKFLRICEDSEGAIGVHCKAGLGRTGSLIGCYLIKHYRMTAHEAIGWMRICRPGSVIGQQQGYLEQLEPWLIKQGNLYRKQEYQDSEHLPTHEYGVYSIVEKTMKYRPVVCHKSPSPPPPMQRQTRNDYSPPGTRPQASKNRQVFIKTTTKDQCNSRLSSPKANSNDKLKYTGEPGDNNSINSRRLLGLHDSRIYTPTYANKGTTPKQQPSPTTNYSNDTNNKNVKIFRQVPSFRNSNINSMKTANETRDSVTSKKYDYNSSDDKSRALNSLITVTPQTQRYSNFTYEEVSQQTPSYFSNSAASKCNNRRRLGRSPSPPQVREKFEQSRATNTVPTKKILAKDASVTALREALSKLKVTKPREQSIGAASLGARRDAPSPKTRLAPSVRSDERPLATQGDMLNSIKFQRRYKEALLSNKDNKEKCSFGSFPSKPSNKTHSHINAGIRLSRREHSSNPNNISNMSAPTKPNILRMNSRTNTGQKQVYRREPSPIANTNTCGTTKANILRVNSRTDTGHKPTYSRDGSPFPKFNLSECKERRNIIAANGYFNSIARPSSPKGKRRNYNTPL